MIENLEIVQRLIEWLGLSENTATIVLEISKLVAGALAGQALRITYQTGKWMVKGSPLEPAEILTIESLENGVFVLNEKKDTSTLVNNDLVARSHGGKLDVCLAGGDITGMLSARALRTIAKLMEQRHREHSLKLAQKGQQDKDRERHRIAEVLGRRV